MNHEFFTIIWGPFAALIWIILYGIPVGASYYYEKKLKYYNKPWFIAGVPVLLLSATACAIIGFNIRTEFVVAPFVGYFLSFGLLIRGLYHLFEVVNKSKLNKIKYQNVISNNKKPSIESNLDKIEFLSISINANEANRGCKKIIERKGKKLEVTIPPGVKDGTIVELRNALKITDGIPGDIDVFISII